MNFGPCHPSVQHPFYQVTDPRRSLMLIVVYGLAPPLEARPHRATKVLGGFLTERSRQVRRYLCEVEHLRYSLNVGKSAYRLRKSASMSGTFDKLVALRATN